jgi:hypothetical protein
MKNITKLILGLSISTALTGATLAQTPTPTTTTTTTTQKTVTKVPVPTPTPATTTTTTKTTTAKEVVQNPDGSWSVIEYPVGKEVTVEITPGNQTITGKGMARVMRTGDETTVNLDLTGLDASSNYYVYAVDPMGKTTLLGPVTTTNGVATTTFKTPMNQFMLVLSPTEGLTTFDNDTAVAFRSAVPKGFAVVNNRVTSPVGEEKQVAGTQPVASAYDVPLLGIAGLEKGETEIRIKFAGELQGLKGKAYINNSKEGVTKIKMRFDDMKLAPKKKRFVLWAVSPDKEYTKLGQVINTGKRQESEIRSETVLKDFGLFVTMEETDVTKPTGTVYSTFTVK